VFGDPKDMQEQAVANQLTNTSTSLRLRRVNSFFSSATALFGQNASPTAVQEHTLTDGASNIPIPEWNVRVRVIIVGDQRVGKSTLLHILTANDTNQRIDASSASTSRTQLGFGTVFTGVRVSLNFAMLPHRY
jgi:ATPase subunit of ABC transporter with duplicated ATPase domains